MAVIRWIKGAAILLFCFIFSIEIVHSYGSGPDPGSTGVPAGGGFPAEITCNNSFCHESFPLNPDKLGKIELTGVPDNYVPGQRYTLRFRITHPDPDRRRWGFQVTAVTADTFLPAGDLEVTDRRNTRKVVGGPTGDRQYISHTTLGITSRQPGGHSWSFDWVAPSTNVGDVNFYGSGNAANGDGDSTGDKIYNPTPAPLAQAKGQFSFTNVAAAANVAAPSGRGLAAGDYDQDGDADLFVAGEGVYALYRNNGSGVFENVAQAAGVTAEAEGQAAAWGDFNGDGHLDLYVVNAGSDTLYRNNGDGTFTNVSASAGLSDQASGHAVAWQDFNGDTQLDLYVANEGQDILYWNNGDGTFTQADPAATGITEAAAGWSVAVADFNGDGRPDIFVANDGQALLYRNNGDGTFTDVAGAAGIRTANAQGRAAAWADFDRDGRLDLFIANVGSDFLFKNNGNGTFTDVTAMAGLGDAAVGASAAWADYDKDGDPDLFVANGGQDFLYRNNGNGTFNEVAPFSGMTDMASGRAAVWFDANNDGNLDLFVTNSTQGNFLYRNPGRSGPAPSSSTAQTIRRGGYLIPVVVWILRPSL